MEVADVWVRPRDVERVRERERGAVGAAVERVRKALLARARTGVARSTARTLHVGHADHTVVRPACTGMAIPIWRCRTRITGT